MASEHLQKLVFITIAQLLTKEKCILTTCVQEIFSKEHNHWEVLHAAKFSNSHCKYMQYYSLSKLKPLVCSNSSSIMIQLIVVIIGSIGH